MALASSSYLAARTFCLTAANCSRVARVASELLEDTGDLRPSLSLTENDLGHSHAQCTVMVHFGEAKVFERKMAQASDSVVRREFPGADFFDEFANGFGVHR